MFKHTYVFKELVDDIAKNNILKLENLPIESKIDAWFICHESDCGDHIWKTKIYLRTILKQGCPVCAGKKICLCKQACNSVENLCPDILFRWHPRNLKTPREYTVFSNDLIWWKCTTSACDQHIWQATILSIKKKKGCPYCSFQKICTCVNKCNSLGYMLPQIANWWHPTKNDKTPFDYAIYSGRYVWWKCEKKPNDIHEWQATINNQRLNKQCPLCQD